MKTLGHQIVCLFHHFSLERAASTWQLAVLAPTV